MDPGLGRYCLPQASCQWEQPIRPDTPHIGIMTTTTTIMMSVTMILLIVVISDPKGSTLTVTRFSCQSPLYYLNVSLVTNLIVTSIINGSSPSGIVPCIANASAFGNVLLECSERAISSLKPEATFAPNICLIYNCSTSNPHLVSIL